jgi:hypothetical protein
MEPQCNLLPETGQPVRETTVNIQHGTWRTLNNNLLETHLLLTSICTCYHYFQKTCPLKVFLLLVLVYFTLITQSLRKFFLKLTNVEKRDTAIYPKEGKNLQATKLITSDKTKLQS